MKIVFLDAITANRGDLDWSVFEELGEVVKHDLTSEDEMMKRIADAEVVVTNKVPIRAEHFPELPQLKLICILATGTEKIDLVAAKEHGVTVCNVPDYSSDSVAQTTFALLLELAQQVGLHSQVVHGGEWSQSPVFTMAKTPLIELKGKKLLIVGFGNIGKKVAQLAEAFGMEVMTTSLRGNKHDGPYPSVSLEEGLKEADVVSLHCPQTPETLEVVNKTWLEQMKPSAWLINTARGKLIQEQELRQALEEGVVAGFAADVLSVEPPPTDNPLIGAPNCILTPHFAWATLEARQRLWTTCAENIKAFLNNSPLNRVN